MKLALVSLVAALFATATVANAQVASAAAPVVAASPAVDAKTEAKADPNRTVCKKTPVTGSRFPTKTCRTHRDWEKQEEIDKQNLDAQQRAGLATCATNPCS
ncbi:MAG: hypothetical protein QE280_14890 [Caulobacter sp.]|jgi:hypothetical protein|nr:hypothetical protein [Caulobacter sp.]